MDKGSVEEGFKWERGTEGVKLLRLRTAFHTIKLSPPNSFGEWLSKSIVRHRALRELNALRVLPVYSGFEDKIKSVEQKIA